MPTNGSQEEEKEKFYHRLQDILDKYPEKDVTILMENLNAKIGEDNIGFEEVMGKHGLRSSKRKCREV